MTRRFDIFDPVVITVGSFHAGTLSNVIPDAATFEATVRSYSHEAHERILAEITTVCTSIGAAYGLEVDASIGDTTPSRSTPRRRSTSPSHRDDHHGDDRWVSLPNPLSGSEDFSRVLEEVPGMMVFLGATPADRDPATAPFNHSPDAAFDDAVLADGVTLYADFAMRALAVG